MKARFALLAALALAFELTACGGGSSSSSPGGTPVQAKGIATPGAVSVVTAK
jgi:hypothetical protein